METGEGDTQFLIDLKSFKIGFKSKPICYWKKNVELNSFFCESVF